MAVTPDNSITKNRVSYMKRKLYKILMSVLAYVIFTTLFMMQLLICPAQTEHRMPVLYPVYHPSYAGLVEQRGY